MNKKILQPMLFAFLFGSSLVYAAGGKVIITSPVDGATVNSSDKTKLTYDVVPGPDGDHLHLNVDGKRVDILHQLKGTTEAIPLSAGKHQICITVNTKGHVPNGVEGCINVTAK